MLPFKKFCNYCSSSNTFADAFLNYNQVELAAYAEMLLLTVPIITGQNRNLFIQNCTRLPLSKLLNVAEEAFALLLLENCYKQWKWIAEKQLNIEISTDYSPSLSVCSPSPRTPSNADQHSNGSNEEAQQMPPLPNSPAPSPSEQATVNLGPTLSPSEGSSSTGPTYNDFDEDSLEQDDDNCTQIGPGYAYQYTQVRSDNKLGAGPWTSEGLERYNTIVAKVVLQRKSRATFERHLTIYFKEQRNNENPLLLKKKKKGKRDASNDEGDSPRKVVVVDLFSD